MAAPTSGPNSAKPTTGEVVAGVYNVNAPVLVDGQACPIQVDVNGQIKTSGGGGGGSNVNITGVNGSAPALTNPLPVELSDGTNAVGTAGNPLSVNVITGGGSNASVGTTGAAVPASATYVGVNKGGNLVAPLADPSGNLQTVVSEALPAGTNVIGHVIADSGSTTAVTGNVTVVQPTGTNLHTAVDSVAGNVTVVQPTGTNLHTVTDTGSTTAVTGNVTVVQPTGTNLHAVVDSGTITAVTSITNQVDTNLKQVGGANTATAASGVQLVGIEGRAGTSLETTAGVLDENIKNVGNSAIATSASGVQKVGVVGGAAGATLDAVLGATKPANSLQVGGNDGTNAYAIPLASGGGSVVISGAVTSTPSGTQTVAGNLTNNNAAPAGTNVGVLPAIANANGPNYTEGDQVLESVDLSGHQRIRIGGAPAIIQKTSNVSSGSVGSLVKAFASNVSKNTLLIVTCAVGNGTTPTVTDSQGNTYTNAVVQANSTTFNVAVFYAKSVTAGANTVTVTNGGAAASMAMEIYEAFGLYTLATTAVDGSNSSTGTSTAPSSGSVTPTSNNEYAFGGFAVGTAAQTITVTAGTQGWSNDSGQQNPATPAGLFSFVAASAFSPDLKPTTAAGTMTSEPWAACVAVFRGFSQPISGTVSGQVAASGETSTIYNGATALTPLFSTIVASSSGATTIIPLVSGKRIRVLAMQLIANAAVNVKWQSHVTPTDLTGLAYLSANGGYVLPHNPVGWFQTISGEALDINLSGAVAVGGSITYITV